MKFLLSILTLIACSISTTAQNQTFEAIIKYQVPIIESDLEVKEANWRNGGLEPSTHNMLVSTLMQKAIKGEVKCYSPIAINIDAFPNIYQTELTLEEVENTFIEVYDYEYYDDYDELIVAQDKIAIKPEDIHSLSFYETWTFNQKESSLDKKVHGVTLNKLVRDYNGVIKGFEELVYIPLKQAVKTTNHDRMPTPSIEIIYPMNIRNNNHLWDLWWDNNLETSNRFKLLSGMFQEIKTGSRLVYNPEYPYLNKLDVETVKANRVAYGSPMDSVDVYGEPVWDPETGEIFTIKPSYETSFTDFDSLVFYESWYFDAEQLSLRKHVHGIIPYNHEAKMYFIPLNGYSGPTSSYSNVVVDKLLSRVNFGAKPNDEYYGKGYAKFNASNIDTTKVWKNMEALFSKVKSGNIPVYEPNGPRGIEMNLNTDYPYKEIPKEMFNVIYEVEKYDVNGEPMYDPDTGDPITTEEVDPIQPTDVKSFYFNESWHYDGLQNQFTKTVKGYCPEYEFRDEAGNFRVYQPMFYFEPKHSPIKPENTIGKNISYNVSLRKYTEGGNWKTGNDLFKMVDYGNWWYENLEASKRQQILQGLLDKAKRGEVKVYESFGAAKPLKKSQVLQKLKETTYALEVDPEALDSPHVDWETGEPAVLVEKTLATDYDFKDMKYIRFHENWYMDPETFSLQKEVIGVTLMVEKETVDQPGTDKENVVQATAPLLYIPMGK